MYANSDNWEDVKKYYHNTFVKFKETGDVVWYVDRVDPERMLVTNSQGEEAGIWLPDGYQIDYVMPGRAVYQYGQNAVMLSRIPARQWKKGMCKANTAFHFLTWDGIWTSNPFDIKVIESFVNKPGYYNVDLAINDMKNGTIASAALTHRISICKNHRVFVDQLLVAKVDPIKKELIARKIMIPELSKVFTNFKVKSL